MNSVALVCNRFSDGNGGVPALARHAADLPDVLTCAPTSPAELAESLRHFASRGISALAVDGGDGTLREVLSVLPEIFGDSCPPVALLPSGKTNLAARDVGSFGNGPTGLERLRQAARTGWQKARWNERPALEVTWPDQPERRVRGLLFGAGAFAHATRMAGRWAHDQGFRQRSAVAISVFRVLCEARRNTAALADPNLSVSIEGAEPPPGRPRFLMLATTAKRLMLGLWPFLPVSAEGGLNWLTVEDPPRRLPLALWKAWRGQLPDAALGVDGGRCRRMDVRLQGEFVVDGELFQAGPSGIILRAGPTIRFVSV